MTTDNDHVTVHTLEGGSLVSTYDCALTATSYACSIDGVEEFRTLSDPGWVAFPLPEGDVVYSPPSGWWVVAGGTVIPADAAAASRADGPVSYEEFVEIATDGGSLWSTGPFGLGWAYVWGGVAVVAVAIVAIVMWRRSKRVAPRPSST